MRSRYPILLGIFVVAAGASWWLLGGASSPERAVMRLLTAARARDDGKVLSFVAQVTRRRVAAEHQVLLDRMKSRFGEAAWATALKSDPSLSDPFRKASRRFGSFATSSQNPTFRVTDTEPIGPGTVKVTVQWTYPSGKSYPNYFPCVREGGRWRVAEWRDVSYR